MNPSKKKISDYNVDSRILILGEITNYESNYIIHKIYEINEEESKKSRKSVKPIKLIINSVGGDVYDGLGIIDAMNNSQIPIHTICLGSAMSMAFPILLSGTKRFGGKNSTYMYHDMYQIGDNSYTGMKREMKEFDRLVDVIDSIILSKTNLTKDILDSIKEAHINKYFNVEEAKGWNIIDEII